MSVPVFNITFQKQRADSVLKILVYANLYAVDDLQLTGYLTIDGVIAQVGEINIIPVGNNAAAPLTIFCFKEGVSAGGHTIGFAVNNNDPDGALTVRAGTTIEITELKRGAL